jgi:glycoprotein-N-acetylgalactosamine 3-beta-galactosyltransferase
LILTSPENYLTLTRAVHQTWASRCDQHFFISEPSQENMTNEQKQFAKEISIAPIHDIKFGYDKLIQKMTLAFLFAYKNYFHDFDWFVKADDDTFIIVENLRDFLRKQDASEPVTFGYNYKVIVSY